MTSKTQLDDDICIYTTRLAQPLPSIQYEVECACFSNVKFTISIAGSRNFGFAQDHSQGDSKSVLFSPCKRAPLATVTMIDPAFKAELKVDFSWEFVPIDRLTIEQMRKTQEAATLRTISAYESSLTTTAFDDAYADFRAIIAHCQACHVAFIDLDFLPVQDSVSSSSLLDGTNAGSGCGPKSLEKSIVWRRPCEFCPSSNSAEVFRDGILPNDIKQGLISNCWVLSAIASVAEFPGLIEVCQ
jgi:hypothetical protein